MGHNLIRTATVYLILSILRDITNFRREKKKEEKSHCIYYVRKKKRDMYRELTHVRSQVKLLFFFSERRMINLLCYFMIDFFF